MKILTKEEEHDHYVETLKGGSIGGLGGLAVGILGVWGASQRYPAFRHITLPLRAFLMSSSATFGAIVTADHFSRTFEKARNPEKDYTNTTEQARSQADANKSTYERFMDFGKENRYPIIAGSWVLSMGLALGIVGRSPHLSTQQKLVQARVYAQSLTIAVLIATAAFEVGDRGKGEGRWETVKVIDPDDPEHKHLIEKKVHHERYQGEDQWRDMVDAEERRIKEREEAVKEHEREHESKHKDKESEQKNPQKKDENEHKEKGGNNKDDKDHKSSEGEKKGGKDGAGEKKAGKES